MTKPLPFIFAACLLIAGCSNHDAPAQAQAETVTTAQDQPKLLLSSEAFADGQPIPDKYTCHGQDMSPPLKWSGAPSQTKSIALTVEDPDAPSGIFTHWVIFNVPATATGLSENLAKTATLPDGSKQGKNSFGNIGYNGPCPPSGRVHHYIFKVYALDTTVSLDSGAQKEDLLNAMNGHILAQGKWTGTYQD
ncbi:MAG TPA: YbhB/YbcL family Raf kinase inhibitor-like protein [Candidatus Sulfotelmatobacter sp.]|nr:YbhB/YbcL family Raf kinase inhibitor-like protein [Candidatus Sulfotelmatobacter sp.]